MGRADATFEQKRRLVELLIDRVIVTDGEVEIRYVVPTSPDGPHQPFCHLRTDYLDGFPGRKVVGQQSPGTATTHDDVEDGLEDLAQGVYGRASGGFGSREMGLDVREFDIGEVGLICSSHAR